MLGARIAMGLGDRFEVLRTSRRAVGGPGIMHFDLRLGSLEDLLKIDPDVVLICAAVTNMRACESDPAATREVNVVSTVRLVHAFLDRGATVIFLSSNTVFDGQTAWPDESASYAPANEYGRQKAEAEQRMREHRNADSALSIVRLSKVVTGRSGVALTFAEAFKAGRVCEAFGDVRLCPVSPCYLVSGLSIIATGHHSGIFHLSGADEMTYADFARRLAAAQGADEALVRPISSSESGTQVIFRPEFPGLGMRTTSKLLGVQPEPVDHVVRALLAHDL